MNRTPGRKPGLGKTFLSLGVLLVSVITVALSACGRAGAQDINSILAPGSSTASASGMQPDGANYPSWPAGQIAPAEHDPYALTDEVGPYEPGLGWTCGGSCPPSWRARAEYLYFTRNRGNGSLSNDFLFDNWFDYEHAGRFTLDRRYDCTHGWEVVYAGPLDFQQDGVATGPGTLNANVRARDGVNLSAFFNANLQQQRYESQLHSAEVVYKSWGWNVIAVSLGGRYLNLNEQQLFRSVDTNNDIGFLRVDTDNNVILGQMGVDMFLPLGRWSFDSTWKVALGANVGTSDVLVRNAGITEINRTIETTEFAALFESGAYVRYFITPRLSARVGYEWWWIHGVALASRQVGSTISRRTGREFDEHDIVFHGASAGFELVW